MYDDSDEIDYIKGQVLQKFPLLGVTMSALNTVADSNIGTAATDGHNIYYSPKFFSSLSDDEKTFIYAHEVMHVAFNHILRSKGRDQALWNTATDAVVNQILKSEGLPIFGNSIDMPEAVNKSAEEIYDKLLKEKEKEKQEQQQGPQQEEQNSGNSSRQQGNMPQQQDQQQKEGGKDGKEGENKQEQQQGTQQEEQNSGNSSRQQGNMPQQQNQQQKEGGKDGKKGENKQDRDNQQDGEEEQAGYDSHKIWKQAVEKAEKEKQRQEAEQNASSSQGIGQSEKSIFEKLKNLLKKQKKPEETAQMNNETFQSPESSEGVDFHRLEGQESNYEKRFAEDNRRERKKRAEEIRNKLKQQKDEYFNAKSKEVSFGNVGKSNAVVDWKKLLKKTIEKEEDRWSYRRSGVDNDYMARVEELEEENKSETEVMLDVSGSIDENMLKEFLRQLKPILKNSTLKVGCFDHRVFDFKEIKNNKDIDNFYVPGGGGTNIDRAVRAFSKKKDVNKIVFTDGYSGEMPKDDLKNMNVIWLIYDNKTFNPVCGKVIYISRSQIRYNYMENAYFANGGR